VHEHKVEHREYFAWNSGSVSSMQNGGFAPLIAGSDENEDKKTRKSALDGSGKHGIALQNPVASGKAFVYKRRMNTMMMTLVTPEATFFSGVAAMVEAPGTLGDFGALPGHMPFISTLKPGVVQIHDAKDEILRIFISGGIAEINNTSCTILAERVVDLTKLSRTDAEARLIKAKTVLDETVEEGALFEATREVELAEAIVTAITQSA